MSDFFVFFCWSNGKRWHLGRSRCVWRWSSLKLDNSWCGLSEHWTSREQVNRPHRFCYWWEVGDGLGMESRLPSRVLEGWKPYNFRISMNSSWPRLISHHLRFSTRCLLSGLFESCLFEVWGWGDAWGESRGTATSAGERHYIMLTANVESCRLSHWGKSLTHFISSSFSSFTTQQLSARQQESKKKSWCG